MPTSDDYTAAAARFRAAAGRLDEAGCPGSTSLDSAFGSGPVRDTLGEQIVGVVTDVSVAADECRRLASTCDARATICDEYRRAMYRYWLDIVAGRPVVRPIRPAPWVDL